MVVTRACHLESVASTLIELADIVEQSELSAGDVGEMLTQAYSQSPAGLSRQTQLDLVVLSGSATSPNDFARGLRRQADELLREAEAAWS